MNAGPLGGAEGVDGAAGDAGERAGTETRIRREESLTGLDRDQIVLGDDLARDGVPGIVVPQVFEHELPFVDVPRFRRENRLQRRLPRDCTPTQSVSRRRRAVPNTHSNKTTTSSNTNRRKQSRIQFPSLFRPAF